MRAKNTTAQRPESSGRSHSPEPAGDTFGQQGEPMQGRADGEPLSCFSGEDAEQERSSNDGNAAAGKTDAGTAAAHVEDEERKTIADAQENPENIPVGSEGALPAEQKEPRNMKGNDAVPGDPSGSTESITSLCAAQAATGGGTSESERLGDVREPRGEATDQDDDLGVAPEVPQGAEEEVEAKGEEDVTTADHQEHFFSAVQDVDSVVALSECPEGFVGVKRDKQTGKWEPLKQQKTSGRGTGTPSQRDQDLSKENLRLASENLELRLQLEQASKDSPRLKNQIADLKEMCTALKQEKAEVEKRLAQVRGAGYSGKTVPELEKTIGLMKKVVERVQRENEGLKKSSVHANQDRVAALEKENEKLKADYENLKHQSEAELSAKLESKTKGLERIVMENERLRKEIKREMEAAERLRVAKTSLELTNDKLESELEETKQRLRTALSTAAAGGSDSRTSKAAVVTRMFENKMKELERELSLKTSGVSELKQQLREAKEREERAQARLQQLQDQVDMFQKFPAASQTNAGRSKELQAARRANAEPERRTMQLKKKLNEDAEQDSEASPEPGYGNLKRLLQSAESEKSQLQAEVRKLRKELENFDPTFFEELEDLKYNYNLEVKKNILLEEQLKKVCEQFGATAEMPSVSVG